MCEQAASIWQELFSSPEMASYLANHILTRKQIRDAVACAPVPLARKQAMFLQLASGKNTAYFRRQAAKIEGAIRAMQPGPGEFFYLKSCWYSETSQWSLEKGLEPYLAWERIPERIREFWPGMSPDTRELAWFEVEKWSPDGSGGLKNTVDYTFLGTEVCYFSPGGFDYGDGDYFSLEHDLNLPVPFRAGDIITIDSRPFVPENRAVLLQVGDNWDCCCLQALYRNDDGTWSTGAVKHGYASPGHFSLKISPLYRLAVFQGRLPKEEQLLETVRVFLNGDERKGAALLDALYCLYERQERWEQGVTEAQILSCLDGCDFSGSADSGRSE